MDAVAEMERTCESALDGWAHDGLTLLKTAKSLGVDTSRVVGRLSGTLGTATGPVTPARPRRTTRRRGKTTARANGHGPTDQEIVEMLTVLGGANQSQLAAQFKTTRQTIAKRLDALVGKGLVTLRGEGSRKMWHPAEA